MFNWMRDSLVEGALILVLIGVVIIVAVALLTNSGDRPCQDYANRTVKDLPVRCLSYYGIQAER